MRGEYAERHRGFDVLGVMGWSQEQRTAEFAGSALKRANLAMMKRNAVIVAGNLYRESRDGQIVRELRRIAADPAEPEMVRETAGQVLSSIEDGTNAV